MFSKLKIQYSYLYPNAKQAKTIIWDKIDKIKVHQMYLK